MNNKGFEFGSIFVVAVFVLLMYIFIMIFTPFSDLLATATANMTNGALVMTLIYLLPVVVVGFFIWGLARKEQYGL
jgi:hypothetical protein